MNNKAFSFSKRIRSFKFASHGIKALIQHEHNFRIHLTAACCVMSLAWLLQCSRYEWLILLLHISIVLALETVNSLVERIADYISPEKNKTIGQIKDISAAMVLISAFIAFISGLIIFLPKLWNLFFNV